MTPHALAQEAGALFSLPEVALRVNELIGRPNVTGQELADVVALDPAMTARLLRLANSAFFGLPAKVETVSRAITLIGHKALQDLVLTTSVIQAFKGIPEEFVDMGTFWDNSTTCGVIARTLARHCRLGEPERLLVAGLLHGIGKLVFYLKRPDEYREVLRIDGAGEQAIAHAERQVFGFTYAQLGGALLGVWGLPEMLQIVVAHHLAPSRAPEFHREVAVVHIASDMAGSLTPSIKTGHPLGPYAPGFDPAAGELLGATPELLEEVRQASLLQAFEVLEILNPRAAMII
jgi:HD-like signal output (HDOD) protein